ncbi:unnamed protein product, partial [Brassica napus]
MRLFKSADPPTYLCILSAAETHDRGGNQKPQSTPTQRYS